MDNARLITQHRKIYFLSLQWYLVEFSHKHSIDFDSFHSALPDSRCADFSKLNKTSIDAVESEFSSWSSVSSINNWWPDSNQHIITALRLTCTKRWSLRHYRERRMCHSLLLANNERSPCWVLVPQAPSSLSGSLISDELDDERGSLRRRGERCWRAAKENEMRE